MAKVLLDLGLNSDGTLWFFGAVVSFVLLYGGYSSLSKFFLRKMLNDICVKNERQSTLDQLARNSSSSTKAVED